mgnify:FL=1
MGLISNGTTLLDAGSLDSGVATGAMVLIKSIAASNASTVSFVHGASSVIFDGTYKSYRFEYINLHADVDNDRPYFQATTDGSNFGVTATSTNFRGTKSENDGGGATEQATGQDVAQSTSFFSISDIYLNNEADESVNGYLQVFDPANTTHVKHFIGAFNGMNNNENVNGYGAGYFNTTSAITGIQFKNSSGSFDGTFNLYGIK